jgi:glucosamine-6-phosphate deaminase
MKLRVYDSGEALARAAAERAADILRDAIRRKGQAAFVAATGASMFGFLDHLVKAPGIAWDRTTMFHLDEYIGMPQDHPASFRRYLQERLVSRVPIGTVCYIAGDAPDIAAEVSRLNRLLAATPPDAAFVGIGENGHLAFNDPPADFTTTDPYILVTLDEACRRQQFGEGWFPTLEDVPRRAVSMSIRQIVQAAHVLCIVPERRKASALREALEGEVTPQVPASILQRHPDCDLFADKESSSLLQPATLSRYAEEDLPRR